MTNDQWSQLLAVVTGETVRPVPVGLFIDSPWLPNWADMTILDNFSGEERWFQSNMQAIETFPDSGKACA